MQPNNIIFSDIGFAFQEHLLLIKSNEKYGFLNTAGDVVIPFTYDFALPFSEGLAAVAVGGKFGYIDSLNNVVIPFTYEDAREFSEGLAPVCKNRQWYYIDRTGKVELTLDTEIVSAYSFYNSLAIVYNDLRKCGYINKAGILVIPFIYEYAEHFLNGLAIVESGIYIGYINTKGEYVVPCTYYDGLGASEGLLSVQSDDDTWMVLNDKGKTVKSFNNYDYVYAFQDGFASARLGKKFGVIDKDAKTILPFVYDQPIHHRDGLFCVCHHGKWGLVDRHNEVIMPFKFVKLYPLSAHRYFSKRVPEVAKIIDREGRVYRTMIPQRYEPYRNLKSGSAISKALRICWLFLVFTAFAYAVYKILENFMY